MNSIGGLFNLGAVGKKSGVAVVGTSVPVDRPAYKLSG